MGGSTNLLLILSSLFRTLTLEGIICGDFIKVKLLSNKIIIWSKSTLGDVHKMLDEMEEKVHILEEKDIVLNNNQRRKELDKAHA